MDGTLDNKNYNKYKKQITEIYSKLEKKEISPESLDYEELKNIKSLFEKKLEKEKEIYNKRTLESKILKKEIDDLKHKLSKLNGGKK